MAPIEVPAIVEQMAPSKDTRFGESPQRHIYGARPLAPFQQSQEVKITSFAKPHHLVSRSGEKVAESPSFWKTQDGITIILVLSIVGLGVLASAIISMLERFFPDYMHRINNDIERMPPLRRSTHARNRHMRNHRTWLGGLDSAPVDRQSTLFRLRYPGRQRETANDSVGLQPLQFHRRGRTQHVNAVLGSASNGGDDGSDAINSQRAPLPSEGLQGHPVPNQPIETNELTSHLVTSSTNSQHDSMNDERPNSNNQQVPESQWRNVLEESSVPDRFPTPPPAYHTRHFPLQHESHHTSEL